MQSREGVLRHQCRNVGGHAATGIRFVYHHESISGFDAFQNGFIVQRRSLANVDHFAIDTITGQLLTSLRGNVDHFS